MRTTNWVDGSRKRLDPNSQGGSAQPREVQTAMALPFRTTAGPEPGNLSPCGLSGTERTGKGHQRPGPATARAACSEGVRLTSPRLQVHQLFSHPLGDRWTVLHLWCQNETSETSVRLEVNGDHLANGSPPPSFRGARGPTCSVNTSSRI